MRPEGRRPVPRDGHAHRGAVLYPRVVSNLRTRTRRRLEHDARRGGPREGPAFAASYELPVGPAPAALRADAAVREVTGIALVRGAGERPAGFFRVLVVAVSVAPSGVVGARVDVRVSERGRRTGFALALYALAVLSVIPFVALLAHRPGVRGAARRRAVGEAIGRALTR